MPTVRFLLLALLVFVFSLSAHAQQVFIKNQPFEGKVVKDGGGLWLELHPLELSLGFEAKLEDEGARIDGRLVRVLRQGPIVLVSLPQAAAALGAVVRENPDFNTVDVHLAVKPTSGTSGLEVTSGGHFNPGEPAKGEKVETAAFSFVVPEGMQLSRDPRLIRSFLEGGGPAMTTDFKFDALVYYKGDTKFKKGGAVFSWFTRDVPKELEKESALMSFQQDLAVVLLDEMGVELVKAPEVMQTEGQLFVLAAGVDRTPPYCGNFLLLRVDAKKKRFYQVITANITQAEEAPTNDFLLLMSTVTTR